MPKARKKKRSSSQRSERTSIKKEKKKTKTSIKEEKKKTKTDKKHADNEDAQKRMRRDYKEE